MKQLIWIALGALTLASCSAPRYSYYFDHYDYNKGRKTVTATQPQPEVISSPLTVTPEEVVASTEVTPMEPAMAATVEETKPVVNAEEVKARYKALSKEEKKEFKKALKSELKRMAKEKDGVAATQRLEHDVRWAAIFGSIGLVLLIIGGDVLTVLGAIALIVGLYFFIRWLSNQ